METARGASLGAQKLYCCEHIRGDLTFARTISVAVEGLNSFDNQVPPHLHGIVAPLAVPSDFEESESVSKTMLW